MTTATEIADFTYYIGVSGTVTKQATYTHLYADSYCPLVFSILDGGSAVDANVVTAFDVATGQATILTTDKATYDLQTMNLEITCTSTLSTHSNKAASDPFVLTLKDQCWDSVLTAPAFSQTTWTYDLWAAQSLGFAAMSDTVGTATCGAYVYKLFDSATNAEVDTSVYSVSGLAAVGTPAAITPWVATHTFFLRGQLGTYNTVDSPTIAVTIINPCTTTVIDDKTINAMTTMILQTPAVTQDFAVFTDSVDVATNSFGTQKCGVPTYAITMTSDASAVPAYLTLAGTVLTLSTPDNSFVPNEGTHSIRLTVSLATYSITLTKDFTVTIVPCSATLGTAPTIAGDSYTIN